jgi:8-oxo-dGTP pyrophosphatase MutT (NUDIX family)
MSDSPQAAGGVSTGAPGSEPAVRRGAKAIVSSGSRVLLVRERHADGRSFWTLPGGGSRPGESPAATVRRELEEELGCATVVGHPLEQVWYAHEHPPPTVSVYTVLDCGLLSAVEPDLSEGVREARWIEPGRPPRRTLMQVRFLLRDYGP